MTDAPSVLVVEDDEDLAAMYADWLADRARTRVVTTAAAARDHIDADVDVVFLDRHLPDARGRAVLDDVRQRGLDVRIVMVTGVEPDYDIIELGFDDYLVKPVDADELVGALERMGRREAYQEQLKELYRLASTKAALETAKSDAELEESAAYRRLCEEFERQRRAVAEPIVEDTVDWPAVLRDATRDRVGSTGWPASPT